MTSSRRPVTFVDTVEDLGKAVAERGLERRKEVKATVGPRKLGEQRVTPDQKAMLHLPLWEGPGQATDYDEQGQPLGRAYWLEMHELLGAKGMLEHDHEMQKLHRDKGEIGLASMTPMQKEQLADWKARGLHSGQPRPPRAAQGGTSTASVAGAQGRAPLSPAPRADAVAASPDLTKEEPLPPMAGSEVL